MYTYAEELQDYQEKEILNLEDKIYEHEWSSPTFLLYDSSSSISEEEKIIGKRINETLGNIIGCYMDFTIGCYNPALSLMYWSTNIDRRRQHLSWLEKTRDKLEQLNEKHQSKKRKKTIRFRLKKLNERIRAQRLACENIFITEQEKKRFMSENNLKVDAFNYPTIDSIACYSQMYDDMLEILKDNGVKNTGMFRDLPKRTRQAFIDNFNKIRGFKNFAAAYYGTYKEDSIRDIVRAYSINPKGEAEYRSILPDFKELAKSRPVKEKISELGLPLKETQILLRLMGNEHCELSYYRYDFFKASRSFYRKQLADGRSLFRWGAARALADSVYVPNRNRHFIDEKYDAEIKEEQKKEIKKFKENDLGLIIERLNLKKSYPNIVRNMPLLIKRLLTLKMDAINGRDPYDLRTLNVLCPITQKANKALKRYAIKVSVYELADSEDLKAMVQPLEWVGANMLGPDHLKESRNPHLLRMLSNEFDLSWQLKKKPEKIIPVLEVLPRIARELSDLESRIEPDRFEDIYSFIFNRIGFDEKAIDTFQLYCDYLGKPFDKFMKDFEHVGSKFKKLPWIKESYERFFEPGRLRTLLGYVAKKRSRDMIESLSSYMNLEAISLVASKLDPKSNKKDTVKVLVETNNTNNLLSRTRASDIVLDKLEGLGESLSSNEIMMALESAKREFYTNVIGENIVKEELEEMVANIITAYYNNRGHGEEKIRHALKLIATEYLSNGADATNSLIRSQKKNQILINEFQENGIDIRAFEEGIRLTYSLSTGNDVKERKKEKMYSELSIIYNRIEKLGFEPEIVDDLKRGPVMDQLERIEELLKRNRLSNLNNDLRIEIKGHINTIKSVSNRVKHEEDDVTFYVSQDPFEALHMGDYFGSCLSLGKYHNGLNAWASVAHVMNPNLSVIFAKGTRDNYIGRNRVALTDKGILCTRFYQNGSMSTEEAWIDYLENYGKHVGQDVLIPKKFMSGLMKRELLKRSRRGYIVPENIDLMVEPAYFDKFYDDVLYSRKKGKKTVIEENIYVLKYQKE